MNIFVSRKIEEINAARSKAGPLAHIKKREMQAVKMRIKYEY